MSPLPLKLNLPMQSLTQYLRVLSPQSEKSADDWAAEEVATMKIGDVYTIFQPCKLFGPQDDMSELKVAGIALVFREDAGFPMNYYLDDETFEMSFMEGVLSSKAQEAREQGLAFYCFRSTLAKPLSGESGTAVGGMHKWGGSGERKKPPHGLPDPLFFFLTSLGIAIDPTLAREPLPVLEMVSSLWNPQELSPASKAPRVEGTFAATEGSGWAALDAVAEPAAVVAEQLAPVAAPAPEAAPAAEPTPTPTPAPAPVTEPKPAAQPAATFSLSALLDDLSGEDDLPVAPQSPGGNGSASVPEAKAAEVEDDSVDLASLENALKDLVSNQGETPAKPSAGPVGRKTSLGPQFAESADAWEMLKAKPPAAAAPLADDVVKSPAQSSADSLFGGSDFAAELSAELNKEVNLSLPGAEPVAEAEPAAVNPFQSKGMEPWPADFAAELAAELNSEVNLSLPGAEPSAQQIKPDPPAPEPASQVQAAPAAAGAEPWPTDFASELAAELSAEISLNLPGAEAPEPSQTPKKAVRGMEPWPTDFAAAMKAELSEPEPAATPLANPMNEISLLSGELAPAVLPGLSSESSTANADMAMDLVMDPSQSLFDTGPAANADPVQSPLSEVVPPGSAASDLSASATELPASTADLFGAATDLFGAPTDLFGATTELPAAAPTSTPAAKSIPASTEPDAESAAGTADLTATNLSAETVPAPAAELASAPESAGAQPTAADSLAESVPPSVVTPEAASTASIPSASPKKDEKPTAGKPSKLEALLANKGLNQPSSKLTNTSVPMRGQAKTGETSKPGMKVPLAGKAEPRLPPATKAAAAHEEAKAKAKAGSEAPEPIEKQEVEPATANLETVDLPLAEAAPAAETVAPAEPVEAKTEAEPAASAESLLAADHVAVAEPATSVESFFAADPVAEVEPATSAESLVSANDVAEAGPALSAESLVSANDVAGAEPALSAESLVSANDVAEAEPATSAESLVNANDVVKAEPIAEPAASVEAVIEPVPVADATAEAPAAEASIPGSALSEPSKHGLVSSKLNRDQELKPEPLVPEPLKSEPLKPEPIKLESPLDLEEEEDESRPQKKLSLQATLAKLEDQSRRAHLRLSEFKNTHEQECAADTKSVKQQSEDFEKAVNESLLLSKQSITNKFLALFDEASQRLKGLVAAGQTQIEESLPPAIAELDEIAGEFNASIVEEELQEALSIFQTHYQDRFIAMESDQQSSLSAVLNEELDKLKSWRAGELKTFQESFEQILSRVEQHRIASLSALESCVHGLSGELKRLQGIDLERLALHNSELSEALNQSCKLAEMKLSRTCDIALAEKILPLLADWKSSLALRARDLRLEIEEKLESHSEISLSDFEPVLALGKEAVTLIVSNVSELKESIEEREKAELEERLTALAKHFDQRLEILSKSLSEQRKKESDTASNQSNSIQKVDNLGETCLTKIDEVCLASQADLGKQSDASLESWERRANDICAAALAEMSIDVETVRNQRRESLRRLQEKMHKLSSVVQAVQAQLIQ